MIRNATITRPPATSLKLPACRLPGIGYATVYNSLRYLKEAGLVYEINLVIAPAATTAKPIATTTPSATIAASWSISICRTPPSSCRPRRVSPASTAIRSLNAEGRCPDCCGATDYKIKQ